VEQLEYGELVYKLVFCGSEVTTLTYLAEVVPELVCLFLIVCISVCALIPCPSVAHL
jgi:hypothetical protein